MFWGVKIDVRVLWEATLSKSNFLCAMLVAPTPFYEQGATTLSGRSKNTRGRDHMGQEKIAQLNREKCRSLL